MRCNINQKSGWVLVLFFTLIFSGFPASCSRPDDINQDLIQHAYENQKSNIQVKGSGRVIKLLPDDLKGSRHQRFILTLPSGQTLLFAHNIDIAPKIHDITVGDTVEFFGEYEWNAEGGVIHWTHKDPKNRHIHGWLIHKGKTYQ